MVANTNPIYSKEGNITRAAKLTTAANDYTGVSVFNKEIFGADPTNGSFVSKLRFKALGTNVASVARIYVNNGNGNENWATAPTAPTGTPSGTGGTILAGSYYGQLIAIDAYGQQSVIGALSSVATTTGSTSSISWAWTAVAGAASYRLYVGQTNTTAANSYYFTSATNSYSQLASHYSGTYDDPAIGNSKLYGEISLPAVTISATTATIDVEYPMNVALPPGWAIYAGLGTTVAAGWSVTAVGGDY